MLHASLRGDNEQQHMVYKQLERLQGNPEFNQYLAFIISSMKSEPVHIRQAAGMILKNNIHDSYENMNPGVRNYIKTQVLKTIGDESKQIRQTIGNIVTTAATKDQLKGWQPIFAHLLKMLESSKYEHVDGAFRALSKICEDEPEKLDSQELGRPLNNMIPKFISFFASPKEEFRKYALGAVNQFLGESMPQALRVNMKEYLKGLFYLTRDKSHQIRKRVCQAFVLLMEENVVSIMPHMKQVVEFMLQATSDRKEEVALEACEFWSTMCEAHHKHRLDPNILKSYLRALVPILLKGMVYNQLDIMLLGGDEEDGHVPDKAQDIAPRHHSAKVTSYSNGDSEFFDDDDEDISDWNLRKCSAAALDTLATVYQDDLLPHLLPILKQSLDAKQPWQVQEAGILALGAIAEGCFTGVEKHLSQLVPYLISLLKHPKPLVRSITCWTLSRYAKWVIKSKDDDEKYFKPLMGQLLQRVLDVNKGVQEAACSAFATIEEEAQERLLPYLEPILKNLMNAIQKYQAKNMLVLYDAIGTLAESVGHALNRKEYIQILMPPLMRRWDQLNDNDRNIFPLLECLTNIAQALKTGFLPFAQPVFNRCVKIIHKTLLEQQRLQALHQKHLEQQRVQGLQRRSLQSYDASDKEFIVVSLDLLAGLTEGLGSSIESLVGNSRCLMLLFECAKDPDPDVRQSAFALLGDLAKACIGHLKPHLGKFVPLATANINPQHASVCNNASWALGEIALHAGGSIGKFVPSLLQRLIPLIKLSDIPPNLHENTAITLGRLGFVCPEMLAPHLQHFCQDWCRHLVNIVDPKEREHAFFGLCKVIHKNPRGIVSALPRLVVAIAKYPQPSENMARMFHQTLQGLIKGLGNKWFEQNCNPQAYKYLVEHYRLSK